MSEEVAPGASENTREPTQISQDELLELLERIFDSSYLDPIKNVGPGYELFQAYAAMFSRASLAVGRLECGVFYTDAQGGDRATGVVEFYRATDDAGEVTVKAGSIVSTSRTGRRFVLQGDVTLGVGELGPLDGVIEAEADGWEYNVTGERTAADGESLAGEIDTIALPLQDPPYGDPTIKVRQIDDATGGAAAMLDALGDKRGIRRRPGEDDPSYSGRLRILPDTVSIAAIARQIDRYLKPMGIGYTLIQTFELGYQTCYDAPSSPIAGSAFDPDLFVYDDPRDPMPFQNRWLDEIDFRGAIIIVVPNLPAFEDVGMAFDDTATVLADHETARGHRGYGSFDVPPLSNLQMLQGGFDGFDLKKAEVYRQLFDIVSGVVAGGVGVYLELEGQ